MQRYIRRILLAVIGMISFAFTYAQESTYTFHYGDTRLDDRAFPYYKAKELNINYGFFGTPQLGYTLLGNAYSPVSQSGSLFLTLRRYFGKNVCIGIAAGWQGYTYNHPSESYNHFDNYQLAGNAATLAFEFKKRHRWRLNYQIYSYIGLGASYITQSKSGLPGYNYFGTYNTFNTNKFALNGQITPFGISYGHKFQLFGEVGIGYKGLISIGCLWVFPNNKSNYLHGPKKMPKR